MAFSQSKNMQGKLGTVPLLHSLAVGVSVNGCLCGSSMNLVMVSPCLCPIAAGIVSQRTPTTLTAGRSGVSRLMDRCDHMLCKIQNECIQKHKTIRHYFTVFGGDKTMMDSLNKHHISLKMTFEEACNFYASN